MFKLTNYMMRIILILLFVSLLWAKSCDGIKCYEQQCVDHLESGWVCYRKGEGDVKEAADGVCREKRITENGTATMFIREQDHALEEYMEKLRNGKEACWTSKGEGSNEEALTCVCDKDLCNKKWQLPKV